MIGLKNHGRVVIYTDADEITRKNVVDVLRNAYNTHETENRNDIDYLYNYYKGNQPILEREKEVRPEICNRIVENCANEIVSFKVGYLMGESVKYISRGHDDDKSLAKAITELNDYMLYEDKATKDKELMDWSHICGTAYRMVLSDSTAQGYEDGSPFEIYTLDPRYTFVVYQNSLGNPPMMAVKYITRTDENNIIRKIFSVYTKSAYYEIENQHTDFKIIAEKPNIIGIPIIEYPLNLARLGSFETVLPLLDAINTVDSNRMDGVEQIVQSLLLFHNVDIDEEGISKANELGAIKFKDASEVMRGEINYITTTLNQNDTQILMDHLYSKVLTICGLPNRNGGSSTSDTGSAVIMRDGWSAAETRAKDTEAMFKKSEKAFLKCVLEICDSLANMSLKLGSIEIKFTRRNYENITEKANVLNLMLSNPKIAPQLAFAYCNMFPDPNIAYEMSQDYYKTMQEQFNNQYQNEDGDADGEIITNKGSNSTNTIQYT